MSVRVAYTIRGTIETIEVDFTPGMILPKRDDRIVSPFDPECIALVLEVISDTPRNRFQVVLAG